MRITDVWVSVLILTSTFALSDTLVAYITCGDTNTGTQVAALEPSGSVQLLCTVPSSTGIAPFKYMQPSSDVPGQNGPLTLALLIAPVVPVTLRPAWLSTAGASLLSSWPLPLTSVAGAASVTM